MAFLQTKLASSGMGQAQQKHFLEALMQTMAEGGGGGDLDELLGDLTTKVLDQAEKGGSNSETAQWLSQQGVSLAEHEEEQDEAATPYLARVNDEQEGPILEMSPRDSAVSELNRKADDADAATLPDKLVLQDLDAQQSPLDATVEDAIVTTSELPSRSAPTKTAAELNTNGTKGKGKEDAQPAESGSSTAPDETQSESGGRKRKAGTEQASGEAQEPKRQARSFAAPTASSKGKAAEPSKRVTRSTKKGK